MNTNLINSELLSIKDMMKRYKKSRSTTDRWRKKSETDRSVYYDREFPKPINPYDYCPLYYTAEVDKWLKARKPLKIRKPARTKNI